MQASDDLNWPEDAVEVAKIGEAWGIKGWFKVHPFSSDPQALYSSKRWFLKPSDTKPRAPGAPALPPYLKIAQVKEHGGAIVALAKELDDRSSAENLRGASIFIARSSFPTANTDEFYWVDLLGLTVVNREGEVLGEVKDLMDTGAHSVLRIEEQTGPDDKIIERLIPFVAAYVDEVQLAERTIRVDWGRDY